MPKPITHFVVRKLDNGDYQVHVEAGDGEYAGDFTIVNRALSEGPEIDAIVASARREQTKP